MNPLTEAFKAQCQQYEDDDIDYEFIEMCDNGDADCIHYALTSPDLKRHADINFLNGEGFARLCSNGCLDIIQHILANKANNKIGIATICNGFLGAVTSGQLPIIQFLVSNTKFSNQPFITRQKGQILTNAIMHGDVDVIKYLITEPQLNGLIDIHEDNDFAFKFAGMTHKTEIVDYLLSLTGEQYIDFQKTTYGFPWAMEHKYHRTVYAMMQNLAYHDIYQYMEALPMFSKYITEHQLDIPFDNDTVLISTDIIF